MHELVRWHIHNAQERLKALEEQVYEMQKNVAKPTPILDCMRETPIVVLIVGFLTLVMCVYAVYKLVLILR